MKVHLIERLRPADHHPVVTKQKPAKRGHRRDEPDISRLARLELFRIRNGDLICTQCCLHQTAAPLAVGIADRKRTDARRLRGSAAEPSRSYSTAQSCEQRWSKCALGVPLLRQLAMGCFNSVSDSDPDSGNLPCTAGERLLPFPRPLRTSPIVVIGEGEVIGNTPTYSPELFGNQDYYIFGNCPSACIII